MSKKWLNAFILLILAMSLALILWVTLFSRIGSDSRHFYPPFWSYKAILKGSGKALLENLENIVLFIPIGLALALILRLGAKQSLFVGLMISLMIESCQWFFRLGSFEIDDLIHNSIGAGIGAALVNKTALGEIIRLTRGKKGLFSLLIVTAIIIAAGFGYQGLRWQEMRRLAALNDREDGMKNLLVLRPDPRYIGDTEFNVSYNSDGSILIEGSAQNRAWIEIGKLTLDAGKYIFLGLSDIPEKTVAIELEYYDIEKQKFIRLTPDVGPIEETVFELAIPTKVRALIKLYQGAEGIYTARPVIYRED